MKTLNKNEAKQNCVFSWRNLLQLSKILMEEDSSRLLVF